MPGNTVKDWSGGSFSGPKVENQDYVVFTQSGDFADIERKGVLLIVCDGSESARCGAKASRSASLKVMEAYYGNTEPDHPRALKAAVHQAALMIHNEGKGDACKGMSTSIAAAVVFGEMVYVAWIGNTRVYVTHGGQIKHVNDAAPHYPEEPISETKFMLDPGDRVLICTDGVYDVLEDAQLQRALQRNRNPEQAVDALIKGALDAGTTDNVSVAVCNLDKQGTAPARAPLPIGRLAALVGLLVAAFAVVGMVAGGIPVPPAVAGIFGDSDAEATARARTIIGTATAYAIEIAPKTPTPTQTPTPTETPVPTATPINSPTPTVTETPLPTQTPTETPTSTPTPTRTRVPTRPPTRRPPATATEIPLPFPTFTPAPADTLHLQIQLCHHHRTVVAAAVGEVVIHHLLRRRHHHRHSSQQIDHRHRHRPRRRMEQTLSRTPQAT